MGWFRRWLGLPSELGAQAGREVLSRSAMSGADFERFVDSFNQSQGGPLVVGGVLRGTPRERDPVSLDLDVLERKADAARTAGTDVVLTVEEVDAVLYWIYSMHQKARS